VYACTYRPCTCSVVAHGCTRVHTDLEGKLVVEVEEKTREHHVGDDVIGAEALVRVEPCEPDTHTHTHSDTPTHDQSHTHA